jgi:hypothetical protein
VSQSAICSFISPTAAFFSNINGFSLQIYSGIRTRLREDGCFL